MSEKTKVVQRINTIKRQCKLLKESSFKSVSLLGLLSDYFEEDEEKMVCLYSVSKIESNVKPYIESDVNRR